MIGARCGFDKGIRGTALVAVIRTRKTLACEGRDDVYRSNYVILGTMLTKEKPRTYITRKATQPCYASAWEGPRSGTERRPLAEEQ